MVNLQDKKRSAYERDGDYAPLQDMFNDYWTHSRARETESVSDLEKHLWLANGAAATISIGFIQAKNSVPLSQYAGAWIFVAGIVLLVVMKYVSETNASRDRCRFQEAKSRFDADECTDHVFRDVRDKVFSRLKLIYLSLRYGAGAAFIAGLVLTLIGVSYAV